MKRAAAFLKYSTAAATSVSSCSFPYSWRQRRRDASATNAAVRKVSKEEEKTNSCVAPPLIALLAAPRPRSTLMTL